MIRFVRVHRSAFFTRKLVIGIQKVCDNNYHYCYYYCHIRNTAVPLQIGIGFPENNLSPKTQINFYFLMVCQYWLGMANAKKCLQINPNLFQKVAIEF